jgi:hypothetical protein
MSIVCCPLIQDWVYIERWQTQTYIQLTMDIGQLTINKEQYIQSAIHI